MALQKSKHVAACLADGSHFGDDREIVDDEADFVLLDLGQIVGVAE